MRSRSGFTLIELLVVVAIIGILAGIATVQFQNYIKRAKFVETKSLISDMALRLEAIKIDEQKYPKSYDIYALARKLTETSKHLMNVPAKHIQMRENNDDPYTNMFNADAPIQPIHDILTDALGASYSNSVVVHLDDNDQKGDGFGPIIVDSWGTPIFYISSDTYCRANRCNTEANWPNTAVGAYVMSYDSSTRQPDKRIKPQNATSFQLISFGPNFSTNDPRDQKFGGLGSMVWDDDYNNDDNGVKDTADENEDDIANF